MSAVWPNASIPERVNGPPRTRLNRLDECASAALLPPSIAVEEPCRG
jgi:hypothetical protein